jgi:flagellar hook protein FlgE
MSLFGALTTAISGLTAQSRALGHISDNVANSQTVGFKRVDTNFVSLVTDSTLLAHRPGAVVARPDYTNRIQGTVEQSDNPLALALAGQGFFSVARSRGTENGQVVFDERQFFTRAGDFRLDRDGFLVNGAGYYLQGWTADSEGSPDRTGVAPIRVSQLVYNPQETSQIEISANLPAGIEIDAVNPEAVSQVQVYDSLGRTHQLRMSWDRSDDPATPNNWTLTVTSDTATTPATPITFQLAFGADGTLSTIDGTGTAGDPAELAFTMDFGQGNQDFTMDVGVFGVASGITQYADDQYSLRNLTQNGVPLGAFSSVTVRENGDVSINYDNGQYRIIGRVPVVTFNDPDRLQRLDGQAFMRTVESGEARITDPSSDGAGKLTIGSVERSNVDIASEFTKLIVAQRAYTANTRIVTASDEMLQDTINMKR